MRAAAILAIAIHALAARGIDRAVPLEPDLNGRVLQLLDLHRYGEALQVALKTVEEYETTFGVRHGGTATSLRNLAVCYSRLREYSKAEPYYLRAVEIREQIYGPKDVHTVDTLGELADN